MKSIKWLLLITLMAVSGRVLSADLTIEIHKIRNDEGNISILIFDKATPFDRVDTDEAVAMIVVPTRPVRQSMVLKDFKPGTYAMMVLHDENRNNDFDMDMSGMPKEGYAYSNNVGTEREPSFGGASFEISGGDVVQSLDMVYLK